MRKITWVFIIVISVSLILSACGARDADDVVNDLEKKIKDMESYHGTGTMTLNTGNEAQEYQLEVSYKSPHYYRISITNTGRDVTQIVLRNDEGVFVLTPHLQKSFRFQSDWPGQQGQVYLYETLVNSIITDTERQFTTDDELKAFVFDVDANYQNRSLNRQKIWLSKDEYSPQQVEISDENATVLVSVKFNEFEFDKQFEDDAFDMQRNLSMWQMKSLPTFLAEQETEGAEGSGPTNLSFGVIQPSYTPDGVSIWDLREIERNDQLAVLIRYEGVYQYSILEERPDSKDVNLPQGEIIDLGYTMAVLTGEQQKTLTWIYDGVEFKLTTDNLPKEEMVKIAQSVEGQIGK
ncbi:LolA family protein [Chengkuizengella axinellae]|uniref:Outer membrane lipoprotein carrier protein LolA n=1 Tax=Chengkuizengella axinellae TaxID=3064388 RepID=A0ABT9J410_9BACL|nr:outer membrane lipoprotein carrier protein LolA [Chengkuizengella sp. 2205SS18-9]MDP5276323.1 outer membrane lipoprotein carrier protein LolA [Chengkuizengella sp. 2205SS18-9]